MLRRIAITISYFLLSSLVVLLTIGLVYYGRGYTYNFKEHKIVRTGIIIIQSTPGSLPITLNGTLTKKKTTYHQSFPAGNETFSLAKAGYHTWKKTLPVIVGEVTLAQYVLLVPNDLKPQVVLPAASITAQSVSSDHRHLAYITSGTDAGVYTSDLGSAGSVRIYTPVAATAAAPSETLQSVAWSEDASHLLVFSQVNGVTTVRLMAANGTGAVNLTDQYRFDFTSLHFSGNNWRQLYWISPDGLRRLDLDSQTVSAVLVDSVKQFEVQDDRVFYVQVTTLGQSLWMMDKNGHKQELVAALPASDHYGLAYANYRGIDVLAVVPSATGVGTLYTNIFGDTPVAQTLAHDVTDVSFSPDNHFVLFSGPTNVTTYDLDQSTVFNSVVSYTFTVNQLAAPPTWFDSFHLLTVQAGRLIWMEYDGNNAVDLGAASTTLPAFGSADVKSIYAYEPQADLTQLTELTIHP